MKKVLLSIVAGLFITANALAQTALPVMDFESGDRAIEIANCWSFGSVSFISANVISGNWSGQSGQATNISATNMWIKSPWVKLKSGNITLKCKLSAANGTVRKVHIAYLPYDAVNGNAVKEGTRVEFNNYTFATINQTINNISFPIPAAIENSSVPYKIMVSFAGSGGNSRFIVDELDIPSTYFADPTNNCLPQASIVDADSDGVADADDAYPNDAARAYNNYYPSVSTYGTLMFEDLWPSTGDYDFNDLVLGYRYNRVTNAANKVVEVKATYITRAVGATMHNGFGLQLNGVTSAMVTAVTGAKSNGVNWLALSGNGTESGQTYANIVVFDDALRIMPNQGGSCINTYSENPFVTPDTTNLTISLTTASGQALSISDIVFNPYIILGQTRNKEVHLANFAPTDKASSTYFGTGQDNTTSASSSYKTKGSNLPWALDVPATIPYMKEKVDFISGYLNFANWALSNGTSNTTWYSDNVENRDKSKIY